MTNGWQVAKIGEVAKPIERAEEPQAGTIYRQVGVRLWGQGAYERESIDGSETKYKTLSRIESGDIIVNKIWARNGSVAVVSDEIAGCFGSGEFPTFVPDRNKLEPKWFHWMTKTKWFWEACDVKSQGTSGKNRIRPEKFLDIEIPLPPLSEQRRIVAHIESLEARVNEAQRLRGEVEEDISAFVASYHVHYSDNVVKLGDILTLDEDKEIIKTEGNYPQIGVKGFGKGLFARETLSGTQTTYKWFNRLYYGAVVLSQVKGWEGAIGVVDKSLTGKFSSPEYRTFRCKPDKALPEYLSELFATPWFYLQLKTLSRGVGGRRERIRPELFVELEIPIPDIERQKLAIGIFAKFPALRELQSATGEELSALLPSVLDKAFKGEL
jgi:type I restriction enzyme S subunit